MTTNSGFYLNRKTWDIVTVKPKSLEGYVKLPLAGMLVLAPVLGGALVLFLPFIGIALFLKAAVQKAVLREAYAPKESA